MTILLVLSLTAVGWAGQHKSAVKHEKAAATSAVRSNGEGASMQLTNVRTQVLRQGELRQSIRAEWARLDEADRILRMRKIDMTFFDKERKQGTVVSGRGTLWLLPLPDKGIGRNDLELNDGVTYYSEEGWELASPRMFFDYRQGVLKSDSGYTKQLRADNHLIRGAGQGFEVKLLLDRGEIESMKEYGNPVVYEKIDESKTVNKP